MKLRTVYGLTSASDEKEGHEANLVDQVSDSDTADGLTGGSNMLQSAIEDASAAEILKDSRADTNLDSWPMDDTVGSHPDIANEEMDILAARHSASPRSHGSSDGESPSGYRECVFTQ